MSNKQIVYFSSILCSYLFMTNCETTKLIRNSHYITNQAPLSVRPYTELPLGVIEPEGWLKNQLEVMASGMTGHLDSIYEKVIGSRNGWLGGDGDGWERGPYWLDGLLPLAYILNNQELIEKTRPWIEWSLNNQTEEGYFGPVPFEKEPEEELGLQKTRRRDWWPKMVMLKVLQQHYMATNDERVVELMTRYFKYQLNELPKTPLDHWSYWGNRRGGDNLLMVYWLYNITKDDFLLELAEILYKQTHPWTDHFEKGSLIDQNSFHCVNLAQGIKQPIIYSQQNSERNYLHAVKKAFNDIKKYHGQPQGMYGADEHLHGNDPTKGIEFCSVAELMYSLENMVAITGDVQFADHLERVAFNALPTQASDDFNTRQYFQTANQVMITRSNRNFEWNHGHKASDLVYGVLTGYPCCTSNMHQAWPKFTQNLWYATPDNGLAAMIYAPSSVKAKVNNGIEVMFKEKTNYPFDDTIIFQFESEKNVTFPLHLRIPSWCDSATININGKQFSFDTSNNIVIINREWESSDIVELKLPMKVATTRWHENSIAVERGPLVYALKIEEDWKKVFNNKDPEVYGSYYYEVFPKSEWNFGLLYNYDTKGLKNFKIIKKDYNKDEPWNIQNAPIEIKVSAKKIVEWTLYNKTAGPLPYSHPFLEVNYPSEEPEEMITLIPYGCTTLRIAEFPLVQ